jgi:hypothetical protein
MSERKSRVWIASLMMGCLTSVILSAAVLKMNAGVWFLPSWPGLLLAYVTGRNQIVDVVGLALVTVGNAIFYGWLFLKIIRAEITARGHLSRYFLQ